MRRRIGVAIFVCLAVVAGVLWWLQARSASTSPVGVFGSGFIEATGVSISPEVGGRIVSISKGEGDEVTPGELLVKLDDSLLKAQMQQAAAALGVSQSAFEQATAVRKQASAASEGANKIWQDMLEVRANPLEIDAQITQAQNQLDAAELALKYQKDTTGTLRNAEVISFTLAFAGQQRDAAQKALQSLINIKNNPQSLNSGVDQAYSAYQTALAALDVADKAVNVAGKQIDQSQSAMNVIQVQLGKTMLTSPISGTVTARNAEPAEIAQPGFPILSITNLADVTLTAFVRESSLGQVRIGGDAVVSVDSFPGRTFSGKIIFISPQMEFTPKNIRTVGDRETTVFAVKIKLANPEQKLKPGMPADMTILY
jgi:HlyD family secretion protein